MDTISYVYFATPEPEGVTELFDRMMSAGLSIDAFGLRDPPRKWTGDASAMSQAVLSQRELNKWCFFDDRKHKISLTLVLRYDRSWGFSTLSLGAPDQALVLNLLHELVRRLNPFLAILGNRGGSKKQNWVVAHQREDCPPDILAMLNAA
jgi:hypothetical protein